jgi:hypothetical protein
MVYYVMDQHLELVLILLERQYSSLACLFKDSQEIEENICASRRIQDWVFLKIYMHMSKGIVGMFQI